MNHPSVRQSFVVLAAMFVLASCGNSEEAADAPLRERSVEEVERLLGAGSITVFDANGERTRRDQGVIPGARLLSSSSQYDVARELPADKSTPLVFYCGNENCTASDGAAVRAREHGYADVSVLRAGIAGWRAAGKPTQNI